MIRSDIEPVRTNDQRLTLLASLPSEMLGTFLHHQFMNQSDQWLDSAVEAGCFDLSGEVFGRTSTASKDVRVITRAVDALLSFIGERAQSFEVNKNQNSDPSSQPGMCALMLPAEDEFCEAFDRMVTQFCDDYLQTTKRIKALTEEDDRVKLSN